VDLPPTTARLCVCHSRSTVVQGYSQGLQAQLAVVLAAEPWVPCCVPRHVQLFVDALLATDEQDSAPISRIKGNAPHAAPDGVHAPLNGGDLHLHNGTAPNSPSAEDSDVSNVPCTPNMPLQAAIAVAIRGSDADLCEHSNQGDGGGAAVHVILPNGKFFIVNSVAVLLQQIEALLAFGEARCQLQSDMGTRIVALLKFANTRSQQLVLGAAAISTAGLKSITARHMAVCSQGLLLLGELMPALRRRVLRSVSPLHVPPLASLLDSVSEVRCDRVLVCLFHAEGRSHAVLGKCCCREQ
jgi:vacuolar protein sorting-associated protein 54